MGRWLALAVLLLTAACGGAVFASPTPPPSPLPAAELKYRVMAVGGRISFCDPDFYPLGRGDERQLATQKLPAIRQDTTTYAAIVVRVGLDELAIYREWKALNALQLQPLATGGTRPAAWGFNYRSTGPSTNATPDPKQNGTQIEGSVDAYGTVNITRRADAGPLNCPICLAAGTRIATPHGDVAVEDLRVGDVVWTAAADGTRMAAPLVAVGSTPVPATHEVVRLELDDGRVVLASPGHPTADDRHAGDLRVGDVLDGAHVASVAREPYAGGATYDILPAGATGTYWANGIRLGSTLR